jgi:DNA polymerase I-like protein with 3'-5' exonuclease and polymerase domains/uracil-DNA glycosylase
MIRFCGEAPGADEEIEGAPFVGESGRMLFNAMKVAGVPSTVCPECDGTGGKYPDTCTWCRGSRRDFSRSIYVYNLCQCRPPANDFSVIQAHYPVITECQLKHVAPAPPGSTSFLVGGKALAWHFPDLTSVETWQGSLLLGEGGRRYVPTFHPAYLMRVPSLMGTLSNTISGGIQSTVPFVPQPGRIPDGPIGTLYLDVETQGFTGPLDLIGVSVDRRSVEHFDPGLANDCARLQGILDRAERTVCYNAIFDTGRLVAGGFRLDESRVYDAMLLWHLYQPDLPKSLADAAAYVLAGQIAFWKGLGREDEARWLTACREHWSHRVQGTGGFASEARLYNAIDVTTMAAVWEDVCADVKQEGRWSYFDRAVMPCARVFWEIERGGMRIDREALAEWKRELERRVEVATGALMELPLVREALLSRTRSTLNRVAELQAAHDKEIAWLNGPRTEAEWKLASLKRQRSELKRGTPEYAALSAEIRAHNLRKITRLVRRSSRSADLQKAIRAAAAPIKLTGPQKLWLLYDALKLPKQYAESVNKFGKKRKHLSANKDCLDRILEIWTVSQDKKDVVALMKDVQHWSHWLSTFASIEVQPNGYIYPRIQIRTATGRAASGADTDEKGGDSPTNSQNWPKEMRNVVLPDVGHVLVAWDYRQQEFLFQLWEAGDTDAYHRVLAGEDRHARAAVALFGRPLESYSQEALDSDPTIYSERKQAKTMGYGLVYGMGPAKFAMKFGIGKGKKRREAVEEAADLITKLKSAYPMITRWQEEVIIPFARKHKYLQTRFGWRRYMYRLNPSQAMAFVPSASCAGMMHHRMMPLNTMVRSYGGRLITSTHDSFAASVPPEVAEEVRQKGVAILQAEFRELPGPDGTFFWCPVDSKIGPHWGKV